MRGFGSFPTKAAKAAKTVMVLQVAAFHRTRPKMAILLYMNTLAILAILAIFQRIPRQA